VTWGYHNCTTAPDCRLEGAPPRLYLHTPWGSLVVALGRLGTTQLWLPWRGYTWRWWPVVWHPKHRRA
jgi:hypothetical protein